MVSNDVPNFGDSKLNPALGTVLLTPDTFCCGCRLRPRRSARYPQLRFSAVVDSIAEGDGGEDETG